MLKFSTGSSFLASIGRHNALLIRTIIAEISATRELRPTSLSAFRVENPRPNPIYNSVTKLVDLKETYHINAPYLTSFLATFGISFAYLKLLAINVKHTGKDWYDNDLAALMRPPQLVGEELEQEENRVADKRREEVEKAVEMVSSREGSWLKACSDEEARRALARVEGNLGRLVGPWFVYRGAPRVDMVSEEMEKECSI
jgi:hypothetical protein